MPELRDRERPERALLSQLRTGARRRRRAHRAHQPCVARANPTGASGIAGAHAAAHARSAAAPARPPATAHGSPAPAARRAGPDEDLDHRSGGRGGSGGRPRRRAGVGARVPRRRSEDGLGGALAGFDRRSQRRLGVADGRGSPTGTTGTTGATGTTGTSGATGSTGTTDVPTFSLEMCGDVDDQLNCIDGFPYDDGWTIPVDAPTFLTIVTMRGLEPGDSCGSSTSTPRRTRTPGRSRSIRPGRGHWTSESWILYTNPSVLETGQTWTAGSTFRMVIYYNDAEVPGFSGALEYTFA